MRHARKFLPAVAALLLAPAAARGANEAACSVAASSYADAILNPPKSEDTDFFVTSGGIPNVMFFFGNSASMVRLPPNGLSTGEGSFEDATNGFGCGNAYANALTFNSSCGTTTLDRTSYSATNDYAEAKDASGAYCPFFDKAGQPMATNKPGFDPDFYGTSPSFFEKAKVYHEAVVAPVSSADGWTGSTTSPDSAASVADFCSKATWSAAQQTSCSTCMANQGYWFDGSYASWAGAPSCANTNDCKVRNWGTCVKDATGREWNSASNDNSAHCRIPNVWMSGNFLNFYPPKFIIARKVVKDILAGVKLFRLGVAAFDGVGNGAKIIDDLNPPCNQFGGRSNFYNNRNSVVTNINSKTKLDFAGTAPIAEALLDLGHYYATQSLPWFAGTAYDDSSMEEKTGQNVSVCFACQKSSVIMVTDDVPTQDGMIPGVSGWSPTTATVANTAGNYAGMAGYNIADISSATCSTCATAAEAPDTSIAAGTCVGQQLSGACGMGSNPITSYLPRVAWYLHNMDLRDDTEIAADGYPMAGKQALDVYTIGFGTNGSASLILQHTAQAGGGLYNGGVVDTVSTAVALKNAILAALDDVSTRSVSFGSASLSTLQAAASQGVLVPRFEPSKKAHWNGHLYAFDLWSEFTGGCTPKTTGSGPANGDYDCDGKCTSVFLRDRNTTDASQPGDFISEDATGAFVKNNPANRAACQAGNLCADCAGQSTNPAVPFWDAGDKLSPVLADGTTAKSTKNYKDWNERSIYTVIDDAAPLKKFTSTDTVLRIADDDATVTKLLPYLNVVGNDQFCGNLGSQMDALGNPKGRTILDQLNAATPSYLDCGRALVEYVLGADVLNERQCASYPSATNPTGTYCTRAYQLGDVFHSSPVEVWPPLASDGLLCPRGLHPQCLASLFSKSISNPSSAGNSNAYDDYAKDSHYKHRNKFALVGANDGMLHAILTGTWHANADDPRTPAREDQAPYEGYHDIGTGEELWGFVPPDLLAKLPLFMGSTHQYYVDATPMVRDVWIDGGTANKVGSTTVADGIRQGNEFHTVAVVGERRGGTHYFALDVTDAGNDSGLDGKPRFLWLYPQPDDPEQLDFGETFAEFVPTPPPIGPVRVDAGVPGGTGSCANPNNKVYAASTGNRCFEERWVAFLPGGFDVQGTKGRGVHMVEIGTGKELFDFSQPKGAASACDATKDPKCHLNYPVAAPPGLMMWGKQTNFLTSAASDGYFDPATFGDTGGQLWVVRFNDPGVVDGSTGKVNNWWGARVLQMGKTGAPASGVDFCGNQPFFHVTANLPLAANGLYRVLAGTGDRFNLLDLAGGTCSPDNMRACIQKGCAVKLDDGAGGAGAVYGVETLLGTSSYRIVENAACGTFDPATFTTAFAGGGGTACTTITQKVDKLSITCPSTVTCSGNAEAEAKSVAVSCAGGYCRPTGVSDPGYNVDLKGYADKKNYYFSAQVFESSGGRQIFSTQAGAIAYDAARLSEADLVDINAYDASPATKPLATADGRGWKYYFDHGEPSTPMDVTIDGLSHHIYRTDERVASTGAVEAACTFWNTIQPAIPTAAIDATTECSVNSPCKAGKKQLSYLYGASPSTGAQCLYVSGVLARSQKTLSIVPPHIGKLVAYVSSGQVSFGLTSVRIPQGGTNISLGEVQDVTSFIDWVPIDRDLEACRHAPKTSPPSAAACK